MILILEAAFRVYIYIYGECRRNKKWEGITKFKPEEQNFLHNKYKIHTHLWIWVTKEKYDKYKFQNLYPTNMNNSRHPKKEKTSTKKNKFQEKLVSIFKLNTRE